MYILDSSLTANSGILISICEIIGIILGIWLLYLIYIRVTSKMAKKRGRDLLGWILLSIFVSPILAWIILLIVDDAK